MRRGASFQPRVGGFLAPLALAAALALAGPASALAQACLGNPAGPGQYALAGTVSLSDGATGYGIGGRANLLGPVAVGGNLSTTDLDGTDSNAFGVSADLSVDLPVEGFSACPVAGLGYTSWSDELEGVSADLSAIALPLGLSVGTRLGEAASAELIPTAQAGFLYYRLSGTLAAGGQSVSDTESETAFFVGGGASLSFGQIFLQAAVATTTIEDSDATVTLGVGFRF